MSKKHHFSNEDDDELVGINTIFKSPIKLLKFSGNSYFYIPTQKYSVHIVCSSLNLKELLPLGDSSKLDIEDESISVRCVDMFSLKISYENMPKISQIDCINIKLNIDDYASYLVW